MDLPDHTGAHDRSHGVEYDTGAHGRSHGIEYSTEAHDRSHGVEYNTRFTSGLMGYSTTLGLRGGGTTQPRLTAGLTRLSTRPGARSKGLGKEQGAHSRFHGLEYSTRACSKAHDMFHR